MFRRRFVSVALLSVLPAASIGQTIERSRDADEAALISVHSDFLKAVLKSQWPAVQGLLSDVEIPSGGVFAVHRTYLEAMQAAAATGVNLIDEKVVDVKITNLAAHRIAEVKVASRYSHPLYEGNGYLRTHTRLFIAGNDGWRVSAASCPPENIVAALEHLPEAGPQGDAGSLPR